MVTRARKGGRISRHAQKQEGFAVPNRPGGIGCGPPTGDKGARAHGPPSTPRAAAAPAAARAPRAQSTTSRCCPRQPRRRSQPPPPLPPPPGWRRGRFFVACRGLRPRPRRCHWARGGGRGRGAGRSRPHSHAPPPPLSLSLSLSLPCTSLAAPCRSPCRCPDGRPRCPRGPSPHASGAPAPVPSRGAGWGHWMEGIRRSSRRATGRTCESAPLEECLDRG